MLVDLLKKHTAQPESWISTTIEVISSVLSCFQSFVKRIHNLQTIKSSIQQGSFTSLPNILLTLLSHKSTKPSESSIHPEIEKESIQTLSYILQYMPTLLKSQYIRIQNTMVSYLGKSDENVRQLACQIIALLPQSARQNEQQFVYGMTYRVLEALHLIMNTYYDKLDTIIDNDWTQAYQRPYNNDELSFDISFLLTTSTFENSSAIHERLHQVFLYFKSFMLILKNLLTFSYNGTVEYPLENIIEVIQRATVLDPDWLYHQKNSNTIDRSHVTQVLSSIPIIHLDSINLLITTIQKIQSHLLPFCDSLSTIVSQIGTFYHVHNTPFIGSYRAAVYQLTSICIRYFGINMLDSLVVPSIDGILNQYDDLYTVAVQSTQIASLKVNKSKKKRKRSQMSNSDRHFNHISSLEDQIPLKDSFSNLQFHHALEVIEISILKCGSFLSEELRLEIDQFVLTLLLPYSNNTVISTFSPLSDSKCVLGLFNSLLASLIQPRLHLASVLPYAVRLFSLGQNDSSPDVSLLCIRASAYCDTLLHPVRAPAIPLVEDVASSTLFEYNLIPKEQIVTINVPNSNNDKSTKEKHKNRTIDNNDSEIYNDSMVIDTEAVIEESITKTPKSIITKEVKETTIVKEDKPQKSISTESNTSSSVFHQTTEIKEITETKTNPSPFTGFPTFNPSTIEDNEESTLSEFNPCSPDASDVSSDEE